MGGLEPGSLPWEGHGAPSGVGVCLSGGGLRAASFALGAIQALQDKRELLFGPRCADHLAAVSGGSYLAGAFMLNADALRKADDEPDEPPLAPASPEAEYIVRHGSYLKTWGSASRFAATGALNLLAFAALFAWTGVMLSAARELADAVPGDWLDPSKDTVILGVAAVVAWVVGGRLVLRGLYDDGGCDWFAMRLSGLLVLVAGAPSMLAAMKRVPALSEPGWWAEEWRWAAAYAVCVGLVGLALGVARLWPGSPQSRVSGWLSGHVPAVPGLVLFCLVATGAADVLDRGMASDATTARRASAGGLLIGTLGAAFVLQRAAAWASLHRLYRDRLACCFSVRRSGAGVEQVPATAQQLTKLGPPGRGSGRSFPRLLVCATANVVWDPERPDRTFFVTLRCSRRAYASFVYSHDRCGIPAVPDASFETCHLERLTAVAGLVRGREPLVSLMTGVASTGAAVSPAMGRRTSAVFRPVIALLNVRLGRWVPNPLSTRIRGIVTQPDAQRRLKRLQGLGSGYDEFVPELFGLHRADAPRIYISDGGHYDNLGLLTLLHARCREIWCVDSEADPQGDAGQLRDVIGLAKTQLGVEIELPLDKFSSKGDGILGATHAVGSVTYPDAIGKAKIVVIKLGLRANSPDELKQYRDRGKPFPYHDTFKWPWQVMWYGEERMRKYAAVGHNNAAAACEDEEAPGP
jgi:hypothetical protein